MGENRAASKIKLQKKLIRPYVEPNYD